MMNTNQILTKVLLILVFSCFTIATFAQGTWASKPAYGGAGREGAVSFSIGSNIYMGTGLATGGVFKDDLWQYNGTAWTQMANFPGGARSQAVGFTINNKGYIATGYLIQAGQNVNMSDLWEYTPSTNTWIQKQSLPTQGRSEAVGFSVGGKGYVSTGYYYSQPTALGLNDTWEYDPSLNNWTQKANFPGGYRYGAVGFAANSKGYVGTGRYADPNPPYLISYFADFWEYNPSTNQWVQKTSYPGVARHRSVGFQLCDYGYVGTGQDQSGNSLTDFYRYDAAINTWTSVANYGGGYCYSATAAVMNNKGYVGTGKFGFGAGQVFQEYTPATACVNPCALNAPAGADKSVCVGASVQIGSTPAAGYLYSWSPSTGLSSTSIGNPLASPTVNTTYIVSISNSAGCYQTDTVVVTVKAAPTANAGVDKTICAGASTTIGTTAVAGNTYSWSPSTGLSSTTTAIPTATPSSSITYTLTVTNTTAGCSAQDLVTVTVLSAPGSAGADKTICAGSTTTIGPTAVTGTFYSWSPATGLSSTSVANPIASPSVTTNYVLLSQNTSGCTSTDTVKVTVNPLPTANAGLDQTICFGTGTTIGSNAVTGMTYSWSPSTGLSSTTIATPFAQPSSTITYTVTVTNSATGCTKQDAMVLTVLPGPVANAGLDKTICAGLTATIGTTATTGITYSWSPSAGLSSTTIAVPTASPTVTTTYILTTSNGSCSTKDSVKVTVNPAPTANAGIDKTICGTTGVTIGTAGVTGNTYSWSPSTGLSSSTVATPTATPATTTTYTLTVTNTATGCTKTDAVIVTVGTAPTANAGLDKTICAGASTTIGTAAVTGNSYSWSPATGLSSSTVAIPTASPTVTTTYTLTITNTASGCTSTDVVIVSVNPLPTANAGADKTICGGTSTTIGTAAVTGNTYSWSPSTGLSSSTIAIPTATPISTTTYTLTVTNTATGCTKTDVVIVTVSASPVANAGADKSICSGNSTTIGTAGVTGVTYAWSPATGLNSTTAAIPTATPTVTTTYYVTASVGNCTSTDSVKVTVNAAPTANAGADKTICGGTSTTIGTAAVTGNTYSWSPSTGLSSSTIAIPTATPTSTTTYTLTVTNTATGCTKTDVVIVTVGTAPTANAGLDRTICAGTSTSLGATAVTGNTYSWTPATALSSTNVSNPTATPTNTTSYILTVSNAAGCTKKDTVIVNVNPLPTANAGTDKTICLGAGVSIGSAPLTGVSYAWTPTTGLSSSTIANPTASPTVTTSYIVTVSNTGGCTKKDTVIVNVNPLPTANAGVDKSICGGTGTTIGTAAVTGNTYSWTPSNGLSSATVAVPTANPTSTTTYTLTVTNTATGCTNTDIVIVSVGGNATANAGADKTICGAGSTTIGSTAVTGITYSWTPSTGLSSSTVSNPTASPTATTTYIVTATNGGCTAKDTVIVTVSAFPTANAGADKTICAGSSVTIGTAAIAGNTYSWTPSAGLSSTTVAIPIANPTVTTSYILTVTNAAGCTKIDTVKVTVNPLPTANAGVDKSICGGNSTTIGTAAVTGNTYSWSPSNGLSLTTAAIPTATPTVTTTYTLTVTNTATGCTSTDVVIVTVGSGAVANAGADQTICGAGSVTIGSAAVTGVTYAWTPTVGLSASTVANPIATPTITTTYIVTASSGNCIDKDTVIVTVGALPTANAGLDKAFCAGSSTTIGTAAVAGNTYSWSPTTGLSSSTIAVPTATPTATTSYILTVTNAAGCTKKDTVKVTVNPLPTANAGADKTVCAGGSTSLGATAVAGNTYSWSPTTGLSSTTIANPVATPTATTTYTLTVTNTATGCTKTDVVVVTVNAIPNANAGADKSICLGSSTTIGTTGTTGFTYSWSPTTGLSSAITAITTASPTVTTTYILTVANGACLDYDTVKVTVNAVPTANAGVDRSICANSSTQIGAASVTGLTYSWTPATGLSSTTISNPIASPTATTTYILTVSNTAGCSKKDTVVVTVSANAAPVANAGGDKTICPGECVQIGSAAAAGVNYNWTPTTNLMPTNTSDPIAHPVVTTSYIVTAINPTTGCFDKDTVIVNVASGVTANAGPDKTITTGGSTPIGSAAVAGVSYVWSPTTGLSNPNISNPIASPSATSFYILTAVNSVTGCSSRDTMRIVVNSILTFPGTGGSGGARTSQVISSLEENLQVYPNPVNESLNINSFINLEGKYEVVLYNALGQVVYQADMNLQSEVLSLQIPVQSFSKGIYQLTIRTSEMEIMRKVVKE